MNSECLSHIGALKLNEEEIFILLEVHAILPFKISFRLKNTDLYYKKIIFLTKANFAKPNYLQFLLFLINLPTVHENSYSLGES